MDRASRLYRAIGCFLLVAGVVFSLVPTRVYAHPADLELRGTHLGLELVPPAPVSRLFELSNMSPGDSEEKALTIRNGYSESFTLYMTAIRGDAAQGPNDLFDVLHAVVTFRGTQFYNGLLRDFATSSTYLGLLEPGTSDNLVVTVSLPGPGTGNDYQGCSASVQWVFTAESKDPELPYEPPTEPTEEIPEEEVPQTPPSDEPETSDDQVIEEPGEITEELPEPIVPGAGPVPLPKTGEISHWVFYGVGGSITLCGVALGFRKKE
ncbi:MAG: LPXTG cell wall anchor domain-containing protein [Firmicutes bacterium]|nr:LPXTG cell wall anchor domain-containing protein [Candidatus Fermentithermobacillaceae bacterium]